MEEENKMSGETPHVEIKEINGQKIAVIGAGTPRSKETIEAAIKMAKEAGTGIIVNDVESFIKDQTPNLDDIAIPVLKKLSKIPNLPCLIDSDVPNKLQMLRDLKLSPEQIDYFQNAPAQRLEGESFEDYKTRRMLNKLLIKYRGQF